VALLWTVMKRKKDGEFTEEPEVAQKVQIITSDGTLVLRDSSGQIESYEFLAETFEFFEDGIRIHGIEIDRDGDEITSEQTLDCVPEGMTIDVEDYSPLLPTPDHG